MGQVTIFYISFCLYIYHFSLIKKKFDAVAICEESSKRKVRQHRWFLADECRSAVSVAAFTRWKCSNATKRKGMTLTMLHYVYFIASANLTQVHPPVQISGTGKEKKIKNYSFKCWENRIEMNRWASTSYK